jgi:outer membrane protein assembly factor BamB
LVFDPSQTRPRLRSLPLISPLAAPPLALGNHLLVPTRSGQVLLLDPATGKNVAEPFQPRLESGAQIAWRVPGLAGSDEAVLADDRQRLFRLGVADQPRPHLAARKEQNLTDTIVSPVVAVEGAVYAADAQGRLFSYTLADLAAGNDWNLNAPVSFGPVAVGERVLVATADAQLHCFAGQERRWQVGLAYGPLSGPPLVVDGTWVLASTRGVVWTVNSADGQELAHVELGQPLASGALALGDQLLLAGHDGALLKIARP